MNFFPVEPMSHGLYGEEEILTGHGEQIQGCWVFVNIHQFNGRLGGDQRNGSTLAQAFSYLLAQHITSFCNKARV